MFDHPELSRVLDGAPNLSQQPITIAEFTYVGLAIQHLGSAYQAMRGGIMIQQDGLCDDIRSFFALPIPKVVWEKSKALQNKDFVTYIQSCLNSTAPKES